jgi:hypothetical protein
MFQHLTDSNALINVTVEHQPDQINRRIAHDVGNAQVVIHDLVDTVKGVLLVDDGVKEDAESPYVLLLAAVRLAGEDFGSCVI